MISRSGFLSLILCAGALVGAVNGALVVLSRVPDVIVTLSTGFMWGGVALLIMEKPGGGAPEEFLALGAGTLFTPWLSNSLLLLVASLAIVWLPLRRSKLGLRLYAVGSDRTAAFRSGVNVSRSRFLAYVFGGLFSAIGGLGLTMTTGIGSPRSGVLYTLSGVAAVVIGGVSLVGGRGGIFGPVVAAFVLTLIPADLIFLNIDPNFGQVIQGALIVLVVMLGGFFSLARTTQASAPTRGSGLRSLLGSEKLLYWLQRNTLVVLILLLVALVAGIEVAKPGTVNSVWLSNTLLFAAPLGILAAGQTLVMLTGGIDLSVVSVATGSAFLMTTLALRIGDGWSVAVGLALGLVVGLINGVGVAVLRVQPLVMTLGTGLMTQGAIIVYSQKILATRSVVPNFIHVLGSGRVRGDHPDRPVRLGADRGPGDRRTSLVGLRASRFRRRRQSRSLQAGRRARMAGVAGRLRALRPARRHRRNALGREHEFRRSGSGRHVSAAVRRCRHHRGNFHLRRPRRL